MLTKEIDLWTNKIVKVVSERFIVIAIATLLVSTILLFVITGWIQSSCYPMITGGILPKSCQDQERKLEIIQDRRTHGNVLLLLALDPNSDKNLIRALISSLDQPRVGYNKSERQKIQMAIARRSDTPDDVLETLAKSDDLDVLETIARQTASANVLRAVYNNPKANVYEIQMLLAENSQTPDDVLRKLADLRILDLLLEITNRQQISVDVIRALAFNSINQDVKSEELKSSENKSNINTYEKIHRVLAKNLETPDDVLQKLADLTEPATLLEIAKRKQISVNILRTLANNLSINNNPSVQLRIAINPTSSEDVLQTLANSKYDRTLLAVIKNPHSTKSVIKIVADNPIVWSGDLVQLVLASNTNITTNIIERLASSTNVDILSNLYNNPVVSPEIKQSIAKRLPYYSPQPHKPPDPIPPEVPETPEPIPNPKISSSVKPNCSEKRTNNVLIGSATGLLSGLITGGLIAFGVISAPVLVPLGIGAVAGAIATGGLELLNKCQN
jgi:hypothetical protein